MPFSDVATFIKLEDSDVEDFMEMLAGEVALYDNEMGHLNSALQRQEELVQSGFHNEAKKEWEQFLEQETTGQNQSFFALFSIKREDIARGKMFLLDFRCREEFPNFDPRTGPKDVAEEMRSIPKFATLYAVVSRLDAYIGTDISGEDPALERALLERYQEARKYVEEAEKNNKNGPFASNESGSHGQKVLGAFDNDGNTPDQASDAASNKGQANDEFSPSSKKKKAPSKSTKKTMTKAATELVNKKLSPKTATPRNKTKDKVPTTLPPSSLRIVTNSEDLNTPEQLPTLSPTLPLFSLSRTWNPKNASSPIVHPRIPYRSPSSPISHSWNTHDAANTNEEANLTEQCPIWMDMASCQKPQKQVESVFESQATQTPVFSTKKPSRAETKLDLIELFNSDPSSSIEQVISTAVAADLVKKLRAYVDKLDGLDSAKADHVNHVPIASASMDRTPSQADITDLKTEEDAKTEAIKEGDATAAPKAENPEKVIDSHLDLAGQETVEGVTKSETTRHYDAYILETGGTKNAVHSHLDRSKASNEGYNELEPAGIIVTTVFDDEKNQVKATTGPKGLSLKEIAEAPESSTTKDKFSATNEVKKMLVNQPEIEKALEGKSSDNGTKFSKKRNRTPLPDSPLPATKKQRVEKKKGC